MLEESTLRSTGPYAQTVGEGDRAKIGWRWCTSAPPPLWGSQPAAGRTWRTRLSWPTASITAGVSKTSDSTNSLQSIVPDLATNWSWSEEGTELTLPLRQGVKW